MSIKDSKKLRNCLGLFSTGIIIACARKKNFLTKNFFFAKNFFEEKNLVKKIEEFWQSFLTNNSFGKKLEKKLCNKKNSTPNLMIKIKGIFADQFFGMTINSFTSVSLNPPLVSFCIDNKSSNLKLFKKNRYFSLNILSQTQKTLANAFATPKNSTKWKVEPYFFGKKGNPIFQNSLGFFECEKYRIIKCGDHHIVIGKILDFGEINNDQPLLYYKGKYASLSRD